MERLFTLGWALALFYCASAQEHHTADDCHESEMYSCRPLIEAEYQHLFEPMTHKAASTTSTQPSEAKADTKNKVHYTQRAVGVLRAFREQKHIGGFTSFLVSKHEGEVSGGPALRFVHKHTCYDFGVGAGVSTRAHFGIALETYFAITSELEFGRLEFFASANYAPKRGFSYHSFLMLYPRNWVGVGFMAQHEGVAGPRIQFGYKHAYLALSGFYNIEQSCPSGMISILFRRD